MGLRRTLAAFVSSVVLVALVACGSAPVTDLAALRDAVVGSWELSSALIDGEEVSPQDCAEMSDLGMRATLDLDGEGAVLLDIFGSQCEGTWEMKDERTVTITVEGEHADATREDEQLTLSLEGDSMTFSKVSDEPVMSRDPSDNAGGEALGDLVGGDSLGDTGDDVATGDGDAELLDYFAELSSEETTLFLDLYVDGVTRVAEKSVVVADDETVAISVLAVGEDYEGDTGYLVAIENRTSADLVFMSFDVTLDGAYVDDYANLVRYVPAGEAKTAFLFFESEFARVDEGSAVTGTIGVLDMGASPIAAYDLSIPGAEQVS